MNFGGFMKKLCLCVLLLTGQLSAYASTDSELNQLKQQVFRPLAPMIRTNVNQLKQHDFEWQIGTNGGVRVLHGYKIENHAISEADFTRIDRQINGFFKRKGWQPDYNQQADGPGSGQFGFYNQRFVCLVDFSANEIELINDVEEILQQDTSSWTYHYQIACGAKPATP